MLEATVIGCFTPHIVGYSLCLLLFCLMMSDECDNMDVDDCCWPIIAIVILIGYPLSQMILFMVQGTWTTSPVPQVC